MKISAVKTSSLCLTVSLLSLSAALTGCSLTGTAPSVAPKVALGSVSGVVHGGRGPVVGANVYVYSPSTTGYGGVNIAASSLNASTPLLTSSVPSSCGAGGAASATVDLTPTDAAFGTITAITVTRQGAGYVGSGGGSLAPTVTISDPTGTGATATAVLNSNNGLGSITITNAGSGYTAPVVTITPASTSPCKDANGNYYVSSDANGNFSLTGDYSCTTGLPVYIYTLGGDAGGGTPGNGSGSLGDDGFMSVLGICGATSGQPGYYSSSTYLAVNELTTVAAAYATAGFATSPTHIGVLVQQSAPATLTSSLASLQTLEMTGLTNAFLTANNLYPSTTGSVGNAPTTTPNGNGTVPYKELNTLGNILADCVNSVNVSFSCENLLSYTPGQTDTAGAAIYIAQHPASNVSNLYGLLTGNGQAYQPALTAKPNDWTLSVSYAVPGAGVGKYASHQVAADASGNIWVAGQVNYNEIAAVNNLGVPLSGSPYSGNGMNVPACLALDAASANVWVVNEGGNTLSQFTNTGAAVQNLTIYSSGTTNALNTPSDLIFDGSGDIWVDNYANGGSSLVELSSSGAYVATGSSTSYLAGGEGLAAEPNGSIFAVSYSSKDITLWTSSDSYSTELATTDPSTGVAIDASGNAWTGNQGGGYLYKVNSTATTSASFKPNPTDHYVPEWYGIAVDGAGNVWLPDYENGVLEELNNSGTLLSGLYGYEPAETISYVPPAKPGTGYFEPYDVAIDPSGNVWFNSDNVAGVLQEMVGAATPVVTPLAYGVKNSLLGTAP
jgi:hypothetical protein